MKHRNPRWELVTGVHTANIDECRYDFLWPLIPAARVVQREGCGGGVGAKEAPEGYECQQGAIQGMKIPCAGFFQPVVKGSEFRGYQRCGPMPKLSGDTKRINDYYGERVRTVNSRQVIRSDASRTRPLV